MRLRGQVIGCVIGLAAGLARAGGDCNDIQQGFVPLTELGTNVYFSSPGGLYPGGSNAPPAAHLAAGLARTGLITPLDPAGLASPTGRIGVLFLGMSNANQIFGTLLELLAGALAPEVVLVNGAQGGVDAGQWADPAGAVWTNVVLPRLAAAGLTTNQVQLVCHYHGMAHGLYPPQPWPLTPQDFQQFCEQIASNTAVRFPQARVNLWSAREYGGYATTINNPEPYAYQSGFAVKWMIEAQIAGDPDLNFDAGLGPVRAAWLGWGPYPWADGLSARGDGLFFECRDFQPDGTHPRPRGRVKVARLWADFLLNSPLTAPWLRRSGNLPPMAKIISPPDNTVLNAQGKVAVETFAADPDGQVVRVDVYAQSVLIGSSTQAPHYVVWTNAPVGSNVLTAVALDNLGGAATSPPVVAWLAATGLSLAVVASDSFESGDLVGGAGWNQSSWTVTGAVQVTNGLAPPDGVYQCQIMAGGQMVRGFASSGATNLALRFQWRGLLPSGHVFQVQALGPAFTNTLVTRTQTLAVVTNEVASLAGLAGTNVSLRFRTAGPTPTASVLVDAVQVDVPGDPAPIAVGLMQPLPSRYVVWTSEVGRTLTLLSAPVPGAWRVDYGTTAEETGPVVWPMALGPGSLHAVGGP